MRTRLAAAVGMLAFALAQVAHAQNVGLEVWLQPWTQWNDDDQPIPVLSDGSLVSRSLQESFASAEASLEGVIAGFLQTPNLLADEISLYDLTVDIGAPTLAITNPSGGGDSSPSFTAAVGFERIRVDTWSTVPGPFGSWADPHCNLELGLAFELPVRLGSSSSQPFESAIGPDTRLARVTSFAVDSANLPCDLLVGALSVTGLDDTLTNMITDPNGPVAGQLDAVLRPQLQAALDQINTAVAAVAPDDMLMRGWVTPSRLTLAFSPAPVADNGVRTSLRGSLTSTSVDGAASQQVDCADLVVTAQRKSGPRPIVMSNGELGLDPLEPLDVTLVCDADGVPGRYVVEGLAANFPNYIEITSQQAQYGICTVSDPSSAVWVLSVSGLDDEVLLPSELGQEHDLVLEQNLKLCGADAQEPDPTQPPGYPYPPDRPGDDVFDPALDPLAPLNPSLPSIDPAAPVALNPQPLPPIDPDLPAALKPQPLPPIDIDSIGILQR
jgi:hypothetical protein